MNRVLKRKLEQSGFKVVSYTSMAWYIHVDADIYLLDLWLEDLAYPLIKKIRNKTDKPIIIYSTYNNVDIIEEALNSWADAFINKLSTARTLISRIQWFYKMYNRLIDKK